MAGGLMDGSFGRGLGETIVGAIIAVAVVALVVGIGLGWLIARLI